jgi:uncharacterized protein YfdQ (DUF2303 family)
VNDQNLTDTAAAIEAGIACTVANNRWTLVEHPEDSSIAIPICVNDGMVSMMDGVLAEIDKRWRDRPRAGATTLTEVDSFIAHLVRWGSESTVVYANTAAMSFEAVLDDHPPDEHTTAARQHRASYTCPRSAEWLAWTQLDGKPMGQVAFADLIESRLEDMVDGSKVTPPVEGFPRPLDVLQVARSLNILTKGTFQREVNPTNGDSIFVCKTETDAKSTQIPRAFMLGIPVFDGGKRYPIESRVRFALIEGRPSFSFTLHRRAEVERDAFGEVRAKVAKDTGRLVLAGTP